MKKVLLVAAVLSLVAGTSYAGTNSVLPSATSYTVADNSAPTKETKKPKKIHKAKKKKTA